MINILKLITMTKMDSAIIMQVPKKILWLMSPDLAVVSLESIIFYLEKWAISSSNAVKLGIKISICNLTGNCLVMSHRDKKKLYVEMDSNTKWVFIGIHGNSFVFQSVLASCNNPCKTIKPLAKYTDYKRNDFVCSLL